MESNQKILANSTTVSVSRGNYSSYKSASNPIKNNEQNGDFFTAELGAKLLGDVAVACVVTASFSPVITVIDQALVQRSAGTHTMVQSMKQSMTSMLRNPIAFLRSPSYLWMWGTYACTYTAANTIRTLTEHRDNLAIERKEEGYQSNAAATIFVGTTIANASASVVKDRAYARLFGTGSNIVVPRVSYALWLGRDLTQIGSSFVLPAYVSKFLQENTELNEKDSLKVAQLVTPMAAQLVCGPLHYLGFDCTNRSLSNMKLTERLVERSRFVAAGYVEVVAARMARILPGYGVGGVFNTQFRNDWRNFVEEQHLTGLSMPSILTPTVMQKLPMES